MPNWCLNRIEIEGNVDSIKQITEKICEGADKGNHLFKTLIGVFPDGFTSDEKYFGLEDSMLEGKYFNWYSHNLEMYGTKWDVSIDMENIEFTEDSVIINNLDTAWSPPIEFCKTLSAMYEGVKVTIDFEEGGCDFGGLYIIEGGEVIEANDFTYLGYKYHMFGIEGIYSEIEWQVEEHTDEEVHERFSKEHFYDEIKDELTNIISDKRSSISSI